MKVLMLLITMSVQAQAPDITTSTNWINFLETWQNVIRAAYGCPAEVLTLDDFRCKAGNAVIDMKQFAKARKQAKVIFDFKD